ncbi:MAG: hypothetical protein ACRDNR_09585 [Gaiellaceae bacterium]
MGMGHSGICRGVNRFRHAWLEEMARDSEGRLGGDFESFGATLRVHAIRISHLTSVGEGVGLHLDPHDPKTWGWWGCFEADVEIARRPRLGAAWTELMSKDEIRSWIDANSTEYLRILEAGRDNYPRSLTESA